MDESNLLKDKMFLWAKELYPINRSLTGQGVRETLDYLKNINQELIIHSVPSGTVAFDWTVPNEWNIRDAWIKDAQGNKIVDFKQNNLHVLGYSIPIDQKMSLSDLQNHLYSLPNQPEAIPYVTSYYKERWGFCLSDQQRKSLTDQTYHVMIDSSLAPGFLNYGEIIIQGDSKEEILLSTYICHPSMGNNEISGPVVTTALASWIKSKKRRYTYRLIFIPETIGSIVYLSKHLTELKQNVKAGFVVTCLGDNRAYSYLESRKTNTLADRAALQVLKYHAPDYKHYSYLQRGSDERQYCSPGVDLPVCSVMRSKYGEYPEYHTSLDNLDLISPDGLQGGFEILRKILNTLEQNYIVKTKVLCEPQLGKRGLYPTIGTKEVAQETRRMINFIAYADGTSDILEIAEKIGEDPVSLIELSKKLIESDIMEVLK
jgi:aminopeptidase-like protein